MNTVFRNVRVSPGAVVDLLVSEGTIAAIGPGLAARHANAATIDGQGMLVLPGLADGHVHLDKTLTGLPWLPHPAGPERRSRIDTEKRLRSQFPLSVEQRTANLISQAVALGTTAMRTHVDIDPEIGLANLHGVLAARERFRDLVHIQVVAFPQSGVVSYPGTADLLNAALAEGADLVGGIDPISMDGDLDGQLDILFSLAERRGIGVDVHLHDRGANGLAVGCRADLFCVPAETLAEAVVSRPQRAFVVKAGRIVARHGALYPHA